MARRIDPAVESLILSAPSAAAAAEATGRTRSRTSQLRRAAGIATPTGRPRKATSRDALARLGRIVVTDAAAVGETPEAYLEGARARRTNNGPATGERSM